MGLWTGTVMGIIGEGGGFLTRLKIGDPNTSAFQAHLLGSTAAPEKGADPWWACCFIPHSGSELVCASEKDREASDCNNPVQINQACPPSILAQQGRLDLENGQIHKQTPFHADKPKQSWDTPGGERRSPRPCRMLLENGWLPQMSPFAASRPVPLASKC